MHGEGKGQGTGLPALSESAQGMHLAFGAGGGNCSDRKQDRGEWETSTETCGQAEDGNDNECVALRRREAQEGAHDDRGGRG